MKSINLTDKLPNVPERRGGERCTVNEVDDIFVLVAFMDGKGPLNGLPTYVADSPDSILSMRLYEGHFFSKHG